MTFLSQSNRFRDTLLILFPYFFVLKLLTGSGSGNSRNVKALGRREAGRGVGLPLSDAQTYEILPFIVHTLLGRTPQMAATVLRLKNYESLRNNNRRQPLQEIRNDSHLQKFIVTTFPVR